MKLVEILAKELSEWPKGFYDVGQAVDGSLHLPGIGPHVRHTIEKYTKADDWYESIVTRAQWQAERDRQNGGEWIRNRGKTDIAPVGENEMIEVRFRDGKIEIDSGYPRWIHHQNERDIMSYRVISQPQAEEVEVNNVYAVDNTDHGPTEVQWTEAKTDYFDGPLRWRDTVNELDAYIEEFTREREALINRLALEGFALIPAMTAVMGVADVDMGDWRNWKAGDLVTYDHTSSSDFTSGKQYTLSRVDERRLSIDCDDAGDDNGWLTKYFKWHSRP